MKISESQVADLLSIIKTLVRSIKQRPTTKQRQQKKTI